MLALTTIDVGIVLVADVERRIGKGKIDNLVGEMLQAFDAVAVMNFAEK